MALNLAAFSGTEAVGTTEHSLTTDTAGPDVDTSAGVYQLVLDLSDMVDGDVLQIRLYEKARAADTQYQVWELIFRDVQASKVKIIDLGFLGAGWDATADALAGTITVNWSIRSVS